MHRALRQLYGRHAWRRLLQHKRRGQKDLDLVSRIHDTAAKLARTQIFPGSSAREGWLYHSYALPEFDFACHRHNTHLRLSKIKQLRSLQGQRILDIGCSCGAISLGMAALGAAQVIGVDYDPIAIELGRLIARKYGITHVDLHASEFSQFDPPKVDGIVWLSNWMWIVKQLGMEPARELLFDVIRQTGAQWMIFESAADDGNAAIAGMTQEGIGHILESSAPFTSVRATGPFFDNWRRKGDEREVFLCEEPVYEWTGKKAHVVRESHRTVVKTYSDDQAWAARWEQRCLQRLSNSPFFPRLIDGGENWIRIEWCGRPVTHDRQLLRLHEAVTAMKSHGVHHRDLCPQNLLWCDGQLKVIDFEWAIIDGESPPVEPDPRLGRGYYRDGHGDLGAASAVVDYFKKAA